MTEIEAIALSKIFLKFGSEINGYSDGSPLLAASSLQAEQFVIFYIENGTEINLTDPSENATALHWAAFCGLEQTLKR